LITRLIIKTVDLAKSLKEAAPKGVDCFFDNVGGKFAVTVYEHMNLYGRVAQCGTISAYNATEVELVPPPFSLILFHQLSVEGFIVSRYQDRYPEGIKQMAQWIKEGKLKFREQPYKGFEQMPRALIDQMKGENVGKVIVHASAAPRTGA